MRLPTFAVAVMLGLLIVTPARGQEQAYTDHPEPPPAAVAELVSDLIDAVNANDPQRFLEFLDEHATGPFRAIPDHRHVGVYRQLYAESRGVDYYGYRTYDPPRPQTEHVIIVRNRLTGGWQAFIIMTEGQTPAKLVGLQLTAARPPSTLPAPAALSLEQAMDELDAFVDRLAAADAFSGAILVARDGAAVYERAVGEASKRFHVPNDLDTRFNLGSMNKMFTAVAIGQLVEQGRLGWDDLLADFVDETWLPREITERIRIKHLLNHTSGLGSYFKDAFWNSSRALYRELDDYKPLVAGETLAFEPGTGWRYSNTGFFLLGVVIEQVTGATYFDYVQEHVHAPAGMTRTGCYAMDEPVENLAIGYVPEWTDDGRQTFRNNLYLHVIRGGPAGGGFSTVRDLLALDQALRSGRLLASPTRDALWTPRPDDGSPDYGYGFSVQQGPLGTVVGHGGGFPGINGQLDIYVDAGYTVAVLSNYSGAATPVAQQAATLLERVNR